MIAVSLLCLFASPLHAPTLSHASTLQEADVEQEIAAAGEDVEKLLALAKRYVEASNGSAAEKVYLRIIKIDPNNKPAREGLRHQFYDDQWFESFVALAKYKRKEAARMKEKGLGLHGEKWVPLADLPYLSMGWKRNTSGEWVDPIEIARENEIKVWQAEGYEFRADDNSWVAPADFDKWRLLLWKCGDEWLSLSKANQYHSKFNTSWEIMGEHFCTWTSADWETGNMARWHADQVQPHLLRIFGIAPKEKPFFYVLPSLAAYNDAVAGSNTMPESSGFSSIHGAYFADACYDASADPARYMGMGVSYWDRSNESLNSWGPFWVRWAAAQSYIDAIDRSWRTIGEWVSVEGRGNGIEYETKFWAEKRIPRWLRFGAAGYVERFLPDPEAAQAGDPWGLRTFALAELKKLGGLRPIKEVLEFNLTLDDIPSSTRLYQEAGLLVAYMLDGAEGNKKLNKAHEAFKRSLTSGSSDDSAAALNALEAALLKSDDEIREFAGL